jgi:hypothetical protein
MSLSKLKKEATSAAKFRGHDLTPWNATDRGAFAECTRCGKTAHVTTKPAPNDIDMSGDAVALTCQEEPEEDDWSTTDYANFYTDGGKRVLSLEKDLSLAEVWDALDAEMTRQNFFPNVWVISDHGNVHLLSRAK